jgi:predicted alpha/beta superfamily hydrolase
MTFRFIVLLLSLSFLNANAVETITIGQTHRIHSDVLEEDRQYQVYLPDSYDWAEDRRYPVLYVLDGRKHFTHSAATVGFLAAQGEIPEMIVVAITSTVRIRDFTQTDWADHWTGGGGAPNFKLFLSSELIPAIDRRYRTDGYRVLSGSSAAGQFALYCLSAEPDLFQAYFAIAPSLDWDNNLPQRSLAQLFTNVQRLPAFLYIARSDDTGTFLADYNKLVQTLMTNAPRKFRWQSQAYPQESHVSVPLLAQIDALRSLYTGYRFHDDLLFLGFEHARQHFEDVSETVGTNLAIPEHVTNSLAYAALAEGKTADAIALFKLNVETNPNSANAYDSLADGYSSAEKWQEAVRASERAVVLATKFKNPNLSYFIEQSSKNAEQLRQQTASN